MDISFNNWNKSFKAFLIITILLPNTSLLKFSNKKQKDYHWTEAETKKTMLTISKDQSINKNLSTNSIYVQILKQTLFSFIYFSISNFFWEQKLKENGCSKEDTTFYNKFTNLLWLKQTHQKKNQCKIEEVYFTSFPYDYVSNFNFNSVIYVLFMFFIILN